MYDMPPTPLLALLFLLVCPLVHSAQPAAQPDAFFTRRPAPSWKAFANEGGPRGPSIRPGPIPVLKIATSPFEFWLFLVVLAVFARRSQYTNSSWTGFVSFEILLFF